MQKRDVSNYDRMRRYYQDLRRYPPLSKEKENELVEKIKKGSRKARKELVSYNLALVDSIAKKYKDLCVPIEFMDIIGAGRIGLAKASQTYDPYRGAFSTHASWEIDCAIKNLFLTSHPFKVTDYLHKLIIKYKNAEKELSQLIGKQPTIEDIAKKAKIKLKKALEINRYFRLSKQVPLDNIGESERHKNAVEEESEKLRKVKEYEKNEGEITRKAIRPYSPSSNPLNSLSDYLKPESIKRLLEKLPLRERKIMSYRFGLKNGAPKFIAETAKKFGITKTRVRQIEKAALARIKALVEIPPDKK